MGIGWDNSGGRTDALAFTVDRNVFLCAVRLFGSQGVKYYVSIGVHQKRTGAVLTQLADTFDTEEEPTNGYYGFDVTFDTPVPIKENVTYEIRAVMKGPPSHYTNEGQTHVADELAHVSFSHSHQSTNGTDPTSGQFPEILYKI